MLLREVADRIPQAHVAFDARTLQSSPESGTCAGWGGDEHRKSSKVHIAVGTLGYLFALLMTPANEQERAQVAALAEQMQQTAGEAVEVIFVDQGYTDKQPAQASQAHGMRLKVVKLLTTKKGFVLLPRRQVVERSFGWMAHFVPADGLEQWF